MFTEFLTKETVLKNIRKSEFIVATRYIDKIKGKVAIPDEQKLANKSVKELKNLTIHQV